MQNYKRNLILGIIALILIFNISGVRAARYPGYSGYVNDFANILDQRSRAELELITSKLRDEQGIELAIVTIPTTAPEDPKSYITGIFGEWGGVGGPEDSGLMILLSLEEGGAIEVETGYGLEGTLPDGLVGAVIDQEGGLDHLKTGLRPRLGQYVAGLCQYFGRGGRICDQGRTGGRFRLAFRLCNFHFNCGVIKPRQALPARRYKRWKRRRRRNPRPPRNYSPPYTDPHGSHPLRRLRRQ